MLITHLLKALNFDLSSESPDDPLINIDGVLLKGMEAQLRRHAPEQPPVPPAAPGSSSAPGTSSASAPVLPPDLQALISSEVRSQFEAHQAWIEQRDAALRAEMDARFQREADSRAVMDSRIQGIRNDMSYFADSMRFMDTQFEALFTKFDMFVPDPTSICLLYTSPSPRDGLLSRMPSSA